MKSTETLLPPLQIVVCYSEKNKLGKELAHELSSAIRGNRSNSNPYVATLSDLAIPFRCFGSAPDTGRVDPERLFNGALHTMLVVFADDEMMYDCEWEPWLARCNQVLERNQSRHHATVICLKDTLLNTFTLVTDCSAVEWRSYEEVQELNNKEYCFGEFAERGAWISLYVIQRCRALLLSFAQGCTDENKERLQIFISHAKKDSLPLAHSVRSALRGKDFLPHWYDADNLRNVKDWRREIRKGAQNSVLVVLRTQMYDTRPWCRQEFLWAEQCSVPIICVEARTGLEHEADRLLASRVPTVYIPDGNLFRILIPALKESLRVLQLQRICSELKATHPGFLRAGNVVQIPYSPGIKHLTHATEKLKHQVAGKDAHPSKTKSPAKDYLTRDYNVIFYADPPMTSELYDASKEFVENRSEKRTYLLTPTLLPFWDCDGSRASDGGLASYSLLETTDHEKGLAKPSKLKINISISEHPADMDRLGLTKGDINDYTVCLAQAIMANEGIVMLGHDWRSDGVMQRMAAFAEEHQDIVLYEEERTGLIENCAFWGYPPAMSEWEIQKLKGVLDIVPCGKPDDPLLENYRLFPDQSDAVINPELAEDPPPGLLGYTFARSLTKMRKQMTAESFARVCIGGKDMDPENRADAPKGRTAGVAEEAYLSCVCRKPLYISAFLGGVSGQIVDAFLGKDSARLEFELPEDVAKLFGKSKPRFGDLEYDGPLDSAGLIDYFRNYGINQLSELNGLSAEENRRLFHAQSIDEITHWVLKGLFNLQIERQPDNRQALS